MSNHTYNRYFKVDGLKFNNEIRRLELLKLNFHRTIQAFCLEIGADKALFSDSGKILGFHFSEKTDPLIWRVSRSGEMRIPKRNTAGGKAMIAKIESLPKFVDVHDAIMMFGLSRDNGVICAKTGKLLRPGFTGVMATNQLFLLVPWRYLDPDVIRQYQSQRRAGKYLNRELDHLSWDPLKYNELIEVPSMDGNI